TPRGGPPAGTIRWSSVKAATSSIELAAPTTASRSSAVARKGKVAMRAIGSPQNTSATPKATGGPAPREVEGAKGSDQAAHPDRGGHVPDCTGVRVED